MVTSNNSFETEGYKLVLAASGVGIWQWNLNTNQLKWDKKNHELFGVQKGFEISQLEDFKRFIHTEDLDWLEAKLTEIIQYNQEVSLEFRIIREIDQEERWISARDRVLYDSNSQPIEMIGVNFDVTDKIIIEKELSEAHNQLDLVLKAAEIGTWYWDLIDNSVVWDQQCHRVFGIQIGEFGGNFDAFASFIHPEDLNHVQTQINNSLINGEPYFLDFRIIKANGQINYLNAKGTVYKNAAGKPIRVIGIVWDITKIKEYQDQLVTNTKYKQAILDSSDYMIISSDTKGVITSFNKTAEKLLEYSADEVIFKQTPQIIHDADEVMAYTKELNDSYGWNLEPGFDVFVAKPKYLRQSDTREWTYITKSGRRFPVLLTVSDLRDSEGNIIGFLGIVKDISSEKQKEAELKFQQNIFNLFIKNTPLAVAMFDRGMNYLAHSDYWIKSYSLEEDNLVGKNHYEIFPEIKKHYTHWFDMHQRCLAGEVIKCDAEKFIRLDGSEEWIRYKLQPWMDLNNKIGGLIMFTENITLQVRAEEELKTKTDDLEKSNIELEHFAYITSHDLKEPLRVISSYSKLLEKRLAKLNIVDESISSYVEYITSSIDRMQEMINDILAYSRVGRKTIYEKVSLDNVLKNVLIDLSRVIIDKDVQISFDSLPEMNVCETEIRQLFQNLIANAMKFVPENIKPIVKIGCKKIDNNCWQFSITDNGIGIEPEFFERIFIIFQRLHTREEFEGTGIGLALCKKIVENHNGKIWLESTLGKGTSFYFTLSNVIN